MYWIHVASIFNFKRMEYTIEIKISAMVNKALNVLILKNCNVFLFNYNSYDFYLFSYNLSQMIRAIKHE